MTRPIQRALSILFGLAAVLSFVALTHAPAAPANVTVPWSATRVADADLDGDPATGAWSDAVSVVLPLENGAADPYGTAILDAKHDGVYAYFRVQGKVDVPWEGASGNHAWLGLLFAPSTTTGHHQAGQDGVFFGDSTYTASAPLLPVDTNGGGKPPAVDASQDDLGEMRVSGTAAPYDFTAEWKRKLDTGDGEDLPFVADGNTTYFVYATTDSDGGGSGGGHLTHNAVTNDNVIRFEVPGVPPPPPSDIRIAHDPPKGVVPGSQAYVTAVLTNATAATIAWHTAANASDSLVPMTNLSTPEGAGWVYAAWIPAQPAPTQVRYVINASNADGAAQESYFFSVAYPAAGALTAADQDAWILTMVASLSMATSVILVLYWYIGRRLRHNGGP